MKKESHIAGSRRVISPPLAAKELADLCAEILRRGTAVRFRARGFSMKPFIMDGDLVTVVPSSAAQLRMGDVVLHSVELGGLRAHRIISITGRGNNRVFGTRGDASAGPLDKVTSDQVLGRVMLAVRRGQSHEISHRLPKYRALVRLHVRQLLHRMAPVASRNAWNALRKLRRIISRS